MRKTLKITCLLFLFSYAQVGLAENKIIDYFSTLFSISGGCKACVGSDNCHRTSKTCRRNCDVSLFPTLEKTEACKEECVTQWASCMTTAEKKCQDYCPPEKK